MLTVPERPSSGPGGSQIERDFTAAGNGSPAARALILIADEEPHIRFLAQTLLKAHGYRVAAAANGMECIEWYRAGGSENVSLVILAFDMPLMNGGEALRQIRAMNPAAKVLLSSGSLSRDELEILKRDGLFGVLPKPYKGRELLEAVAAALA